MLQNVTECYRVVKGVTQCYRVLQGVAEYHRVLQNITEHYRVFLAHILGPIFGLVSFSFSLPPLRRTHCLGHSHGFIGNRLYICGEEAALTKSHLGAAIV